MPLILQTVQSCESDQSLTWGHWGVFFVSPYMGDSPRKDKSGILNNISRLINPSYRLPWSFGTLCQIFKGNWYISALILMFLLLKSFAWNAHFFSMHWKYSHTIFIEYKWTASTAIGKMWKVVDIHFKPVWVIVNCWKPIYPLHYTPGISDTFWHKSWLRDKGFWQSLTTDFEHTLGILTVFFMSCQNPLGLPRGGPQGIHTDRCIRGM